MAVIVVPATVRFQNFDIWCDAVSEDFTSSFNGKRQVAKKAFDVWNFEGELVPLDPADAGSVKSFLMKLAGRVNTFKLKIAGSRYPVSNYQGANGLSYSPGQSGVGANFDGFPVNTTILKEGDYFNIGNELKVATADSITNNNGELVVYFMPPLRSLTVNNVTVMTVTDPFLYLHAKDDDVARWKVSAPTRHAFTLEAEEEV